MIKFKQNLSKRKFKPPKKGNMPSVLDFSTKAKWNSGNHFGQSICLATNRRQKSRKKKV